MLSQAALALPMLHVDASILDCHQPRRTRLFRRCLVLDAQLHPHDFRANANRALHRCGYFLRPPENIHDVYFLRHIFQPRITLLPQHFPLVRVHRNNPVSCVFHILGHAKARPHRIRRQPDHRDRLVRLQNFCNWIFAGRSSALHAIGEVNSHRLASSPLAARRRTACAIAARHFSFSSAVPTEMRIASGNPIQPSGRTITPSCSSSSLNALASGPTVMNTKFASLATGRYPSFANPSVKRFRSTAFVSMQRLTCSLSSSAARAAACATPDVLNGVRNLFIAATSSGRPMAYPIRNPASPYTFENVRKISRFFLLRYASTESRNPMLTA